MTHIFTFHVGNLTFGIDILCVQEIVRYQPMTRVPLAQSIVRGLINLRGQIVMALDMRKGLGLEPSEREDQMINVMVYDEGETVSLLVDGIGDVLALDPDRFESTPATLRSGLKGLARSVCQTEDGLLLLLDTQSVSRFSSTN